MVYCSTNTPIVIAAICKTNFLRISYDGMMKYVRTVAAFAYDPHQTATTLTFLPGQGLQPRSTITSPQMEKHSSDGGHASRVCLFLHRPASPIILRSKAFGLFGCQTGSDWPSSSLSLCRKNHDSRIGNCGRLRQPLILSVTAGRYISTLLGRVTSR